MSEYSWLSSLTSLGVGGVLAIIMFLCYRQDRNKSEDRLTKLLREDQKSREENTKVMTELVNFITCNNGSGRH